MIFVNSYICTYVHMYVMYKIAEEKKTTSDLQSYSHSSHSMSMSKAMEQMQRLQGLEDLSNRMLAIIADEKKFLREQMKRENESSSNDDVDTDAPDAEYGNSKTAVQILEERKAQDYVTMSKPIYYQKKEHGAWFCKLSVKKTHFEYSALTKKDAYQLCAAAALEHFQLL